MRSANDSARCCFHSRADEPCDDVGSNTAACGAATQFRRAPLSHSGRMLTVQPGAPARVQAPAAAG